MAVRINKRLTLTLIVSVVIDQYLVNLRILGRLAPRRCVGYQRCGGLVQMSHQQVVADHRLIQVGLERSVSTLAQSIIAEVALQAFNHPFHRGATRHHGLESLGHGGIGGVDLFQGIERNGDGSTR